MTSNNCVILFYSLSIFVLIVNTIIPVVEGNIHGFTVTEQFEPCDWPAATDGLRSKSKMKTTIGNVHFYDPFCPPGFLDIANWTAIVMQNPTTCYTYTSCQARVALSPEQLAASYVLRGGGGTVVGLPAAPAAPAAPVAPVAPAAPAAPVAPATPVVPVAPAQPRQPVTTGAFPF